MEQVTTGIKKAHENAPINTINSMQLKKNKIIKVYFNDKVVTHSAVVEKFCEIGIPHKADIKNHSRANS